MARLSTDLRIWVLALLVPAACIDTPSTGQSGSEFTPPAGDLDGDDDDQGVGLDNTGSRDAPCPCGLTSDTPPVRGTVLSWHSGLLEIEVAEVLGDAPAAQDAPEVGSTMLGMFDGGLPCWRGLYLPEPGDEVVAFLVLEDGAKPWCCETAACGPMCEGDGAADGVDSCLAACQEPARDVCDAEFADVEVRGWLKAAPLEGDGFELARAGDTSFRAELGDLPAFSADLDSCIEQVGEVRDVLADVEDPPGTPQPPRWRDSCPGLSESDP
ncbi:MAG: hypothetical protein OXT09_05550 [Myxococcales bacterium]|nr:hypothetical protein [Myxococcales bacterium]